MAAKRYHQKRGSDDDMLALTTIDSEQQSKGSETEYEFQNVKWKDYVTKKKYIRTSGSLAYRGVEWKLMRGSVVDCCNYWGCIGGIDVIISRSDC